MNNRPYVDNINDILDNEIARLLNKQENNTKDTLVLSGGSLKGFAQIGALHCLKQNGILDKIRNVAGTSAGSMIGLLFCAGYQPLELFKLMKLINLKKTRKLDTTNIITKYGLDNGERIMLVLSKLINAKGFDKNTTLKEFYRKTLINFIVTGSCINDKKIYYFSHTNFPNMKVLEAIRISISIPIIFTPVIYEGKVFVDGGCIDNYPIQLFNDRLNHCIGIYVTEDRKYADEIKFIEQYLNNTVQCLFEGVTHGATKGYDQQTIKIKCMKHDNTPTGITGLFDEGYKAAQKKIDSGNFI